MTTDKLVDDCAKTGLEGILHMLRGAVNDIHLDAYYYKDQVNDAKKVLLEFAQPFAHQAAAEKIRAASAQTLIREMTKGNLSTEETVTMLNLLNNPSRPQWLSQVDGLDGEDSRVE